MHIAVRADLLLVLHLLLQLQLGFPHEAPKLHGAVLNRQGLQLLHLLRRQSAQRQLLQLLLVLLLLHPLLLRRLQRTTLRWSADEQHHPCS